MNSMPTITIILRFITDFFFYIAPVEEAGRNYSEEEDGENLGDG